MSNNIFLKVNLRLKTLQKWPCTNSNDPIRNGIKFPVNTSLFVRKYCLKHYFLLTWNKKYIKQKAMLCNVSVTNKTVKMWFSNCCFVFYRATDESDRERLLSTNSGENSQDLLQPQSDFQIRNRYLSRIGANVSLTVFPTGYEKLAPWPSFSSLLDVPPLSLAL